MIKTVCKGSAFIPIEQMGVVPKKIGSVNFRFFLVLSIIIYE